MNQNIVVFDFGGVLTGEPDRGAVVQFLCSTFDLTEAEFEKVNRVKKEAHLRGVTDEEFWLSYAHNQKIDLPQNWANELKAVMKKALGVNPSMLELVEKLKENGTSVALLSNIDYRLAKLVKEFGYYELFEPCLLSCEIELEKPDPKIYQYLIETLAAPAESILFIDDKLENIEAAQKLGIDAIHFRSQEQLCQELTARGILCGK